MSVYQFVAPICWDFFADFGGGFEHSRTHLWADTERMSVSTDFIQPSPRPCPAPPGPAPAMFPADARVGTDPPLALYVMEREAHAEVCKPESLRLLQDLLADDSPLRAPLLRLFQCALGGLPSHHLNRLQFRQWVRESEVERLDHGLQMQLELWFVPATPIFSPCGREGGVQ